MLSIVAEKTDKRSAKSWLTQAGLAVAGGCVACFLLGTAQAGQIKTVFVIAMENHNWTQPASQTSPGQIFGNPAAPYINSLVTGGNPNAAQVSYASNYLNAGQGIHPSEPNYIWAEAGSNLGIFNDADPYPNNVSDTPASLSNYLLISGHTWRSYQEDTDVNLTNNQPLPKNQYTVPLNSKSGTFSSGTNNIMAATSLTTPQNTILKYSLRLLTAATIPRLPIRWPRTTLPCSSSQAIWQIIRSLNTTGLHPTSLMISTRP